MIRIVMLILQSVILQLYFKKYSCDDYLINTPACKIRSFNASHASADVNSCGKRKIELLKISGDMVLVDVKGNLLDARCCYKNLYRYEGQGDEGICRKFKHQQKLKLESDVVQVKCYSKLTNELLYEDSYVFTLKQDGKEGEESQSGKHWNVMLLGLDTVSRNRALTTMPLTTSYLKQNNWLDFQGYTKVGDSTKPNLRAVAQGTEWIWPYTIFEKYQVSGFVTAYAEDYAAQGETYPDLNFQHYIKRLFKTTETYVGPAVCTNQIPSGIHILNYALDFMSTYRNHKFFGFQWITSFSHEINQTLNNFDAEILGFFEKVSALGVLDNTFFIFLSDHGYRYRSYDKTKVWEDAMFYDARLPMLFIHVPERFKVLYPEMSAAVNVNQKRLTSHYDLHKTLLQILMINKGIDIHNSTFALKYRHYCPECKGLLREVPDNRTCYDAGIDGWWCPCGSLTTLDQKDTEARKVIEFCKKYIKQRLPLMESFDRCYYCETLEFDYVLRIQKYSLSSAGPYYLIAIVLRPESVILEIVVSNSKGYKVEIENTISEHGEKGFCANFGGDKYVCVCKKYKNCHSARRNDIKI